MQHVPTVHVRMGMSIQEKNNTGWFSLSGSHVCFNASWEAQDDPKTICVAKCSDPKVAALLCGSYKCPSQLFKGLSLGVVVGRVGGFSYFN